MTDWTSLHGNITLYDYLRKRRNPTFLNRNLVQALWLHEKDVNRTTTGRPVSERASWVPPTIDMIKKNENSKGLSIAVHGIKLKDHQGPPSSVQEEGNRTLMLMSRCEIRVRVEIWNPDADRCCIVKEIPGAILVTDQAWERAMTIELLDVIFIPVHDIRTNSFAHEPSWVKLEAPSYQLRMSLLFNSHLDSRVVLDHTRLRISRPLTHNSPTRWMARIDNIKELHASDQILPLSCDCEDDKMDLDLGLQIHIGWTPVANSIITAANLQQRKSGPSQSLPVSRSATSQKTYVIFEHSGGIETYRGIQCPFCVTDGRSKSFLRISDLQLHLDYKHPSFQYSFEDDISLVHGHQGWRIRISLADESREDKRRNEIRQNKVIHNIGRTTSNDESSSNISSTTSNSTICLPDFSGNNQHNSSSNAKSTNDNKDINNPLTKTRFIPA